jgi:hypothetical protein
LVTEHFAATTAGALKAANLNQGQIDRCVRNQGGAKVVDAIKDGSA